MSRRRTLTGSEKALWDKIARTVVPLRPETSVPTIEAAKAPTKPAEVEMPAPKSLEPPPAVPPQTAKPAASLRPTSDLDRKTRRKLARGALAIDARIDLHGMTQEEAHGALARFIVSSAGMRRRVVLVITGKGMRGGRRPGGPAPQCPSLAGQPRAVAPRRDLRSGAPGTRR